ncbi:MAG TPA: phytanoyl-CoA dioxygenase family protein [Caldilineaceae bacterium]|nr:phytanoyl-CoA dioxygenase family protein [Caldilineaceae bacterium]
MTEELQPFNEANALLADPQALRRQMQRDGYLFFRGLLPAAPVNDLYAEIMAICRSANWADADDHPVGQPRLEGSPEFWEVYDQVQVLEDFHALPHRRELLEIIATLVQETPFVHPRNIARISFPQAQHFTTPPHQDYVHIQGTPEVYTTWLPLCDCPQALGGVAVLAGSHVNDILPVHKANGAGGLGIHTEDLGLPWHTSDYRAGDVLVFHSHTVHKALPNITRDQIRISVDYRYQGVSGALVEDGLLPHYNRLTWDQIYQGWRRPELQYYWRDLPLTTVARDGSFHANAKPTQN